LITTSSWGNGTRDVHALADQLPPEVPDHVCVAEVVKVIPELPKASPELPAIADRFQEPAPAPVMSIKSALVTVTVAAFRVAEVPTVRLLTKSRLVTLLPLIVSVPVMVCVVPAVMPKSSVFTAVPVRVRLAKVLLPTIQGSKPEKVTLL